MLTLLTGLAAALALVAWCYRCEAFALEERLRRAWTCNEHLRNEGVALYRQWMEAELKRLNAEARLDRLLEWKDYCERTEGNP